MSIRKKILLYFSVAVILLSGAAFIFVYTLFSGYREEDFQQRQKDRITTTLKFLTGVKAIDEDIVQILDSATIHHIYDEKLLIFNREKELIYSSIDDTPIPFSRNILMKLSAKEPWIEKKDGLYDVVGMYMEHSGRVYYGISKAYDSSGYKKLRYLRYVLLFTFLGISATIGFVAYFLAGKITRSVVDITKQIRNYDPDNPYTPIVISGGRDEIAVLAQRFNDLMQKLSDAFSFQKHAVQHISHELKTPIAVLVSNFERIEQEKDTGKIMELIKNQKEGTKNLSEIINSLLEIAKVDSGINTLREGLRVDELIFDLADELKVLYPGFLFSVEYGQATEDDDMLTIRANPRLLRAALMNLMLNCVHYSDNSRADIVITPLPAGLQVAFISAGPVISDSEKQYLFRHFFRGGNSRDKPGFGLGLVFINRIITLHGGTVSYTSNGVNRNIFTILLPLR